MRDRVAASLILVVVSMLAGCRGKLQAKYQPGDQTAKAGTTECTFGTEAVGGVPAGAEVFTGNWAIRAEADAP